MESFSHYYRLLGRDPAFLPAAELAEVLDAAGVGADTVDYLLRQHTYSIDKARGMLGYEPKVGLAEGMDRCETWLRESGLLG